MESDGFPGGVFRGGVNGGGGGVGSVDSIGGGGDSAAAAAAAAAATLWHFKDLSPPVHTSFENLDQNSHAQLLVTKVKRRREG